MDQEKGNAELIVGCSFRRETEAKTESKEVSEQKELEWKQIRRTRSDFRERQYTDGISSEDSLLSVDIIRCDILWVKMSEIGKDG